MCPLCPRPLKREEEEEEEEEEEKAGKEQKGTKRFYSSFEATTAAKRWKPCV
jgi:hypothetical protein